MEEKKFHIDRNLLTAKPILLLFVQIWSQALQERKVLLVASPFLPKLYAHILHFCDQDNYRAGQKYLDKT